MMLYCPEERQEAVIGALTELGLQHRSFTFEDHGVQVMQAAPWQGAHMPHRIPLVMEGMQMESSDALLSALTNQ